jgi:hypothetical protein
MADFYSVEAPAAAKPTVKRNANAARQAAPHRSTFVCDATGAAGGDRFAADAADVPKGARGVHHVITASATIGAAATFALGIAGTTAKYRAAAVITAVETPETVRSRRRSCRPSSRPTSSSSSRRPSRRWSNGGEKLVVETFYTLDQLNRPPPRRSPAPKRGGPPALQPDRPAFFPQSPWGGSARCSPTFRSPISRCSISARTIGSTIPTKAAARRGSSRTPGSRPSCSCSAKPIGASRCARRARQARAAEPDWPIALDRVAFPLPADMVRFVEIIDPELDDDDDSYSIEGGPNADRAAVTEDPGTDHRLAMSAPRRVAGSARWPPPFVEAFTWRLAWQISDPLSADKGRKDRALAADKAIAPPSAPTTGPRAARAISTTPWSRARAAPACARPEREGPHADLFLQRRRDLAPHGRPLGSRRDLRSRGRADAQFRGDGRRAGAQAFGLPL